MQNAEDVDAACERVGDRLEDERGGLRVRNLHRLALLGRRRDALDEQVEERRGAEVLRRDAAGDRKDLAARDRVLECVRDFLDAELLALEVALHQPLVDLDDFVEKFRPVLLDLGGHVSGDLARAGFAFAVRIRVGAHVQQVDDAGDLVLGADRDVHGDAALRDL